MLIRKTIETDIPRMLAVYDAARRYMRRSGNLHQWSDSYPSEGSIRLDMERGGSFVCLDENGDVAGTFFFLIGTDPTYNKIYDGKWLNDKPYGVIHRIASDGRIKHLLHQVLDFCFTQTDTIRIDTHCDNHTMIDGLSACGFTYCGIIHLANGDARMAFQKSQVSIEQHPLEPFLPENCRILFLGSFPPPNKRWCMDFFYPNWINDHWRIEGLVWFGDRNRFVDNESRTFRLSEIKAFLNEKGIGFYDTAKAVRRLADNASDKFLEIVEPTDISALIAPLKELQAIAVTGEKACETICAYYDIKEAPKTGAFITLPDGLRLYRLPSSSRAYPLSIEKKSEAYRRMFEELLML